MESKFTKKQGDKYLEVTYNHGLELKSHRLKFNASQYCTNETDAEVFIKRAESIEKELDKVLLENKSYHNAGRIMLMYMQAIEAIASGIEIRSKLKDDELARRFFEGYNTKHLEAVAFCEKTMEMYNAGGKDEGYSTHWRDYDKLNELIDEYNLGFKKLSMDDFKVSFSSMNDNMSDILQKLIDLNKDKEENPNE